MPTPACKLPAASSPAHQRQIRPDRHLAPVHLLPSRYLRYSVLGVHVFMGICISGALLRAKPIDALAPLASGFWGAIILALIFSALVADRRRVRSVQCLSFTEQGWLLADLNGVHEMNWVGKAVVWRWLIVMRFNYRHTGKQIALVVLPDGASAADRRRLRVWLRTLGWRAQD